jgi:hypothetical protein
MSVLAKTLGFTHGLFHYVGCVLGNPFAARPPGRLPAATRHPLFPPSRLDTDGHYQASFVLWSLPQGAVRQMLPAALEPAAQSLTGAGQHPLMFVFGEQQHVRPIIHRGAGLTYREFITVVPFVQWTAAGHGYRGPFAFLPRLFLDRWLPVVLGWLVGFAKRRERVHMGPGGYAVSRLLRKQPIVGASFVPHGPVGRCIDFPLFSALRPIFELPLITRLAVGPFLAMNFTWELERAQMQATAADVHIHEAYVRGLPITRFHAEGIDRNTLGAFALNVPWTLSLPVAPFSLS